ncbi:hypothetical protein THAOC_05462 [Thalassiosira oceanica]|uniref:Uncharacterized protein n=1 Tax=Thalassiosira oceanica TaxID=159749 RepID=K0T2R6_THAOC|nr:hypothetical protein THAOC_05462 [Thalassiosira oceanica]|eukprot:EJK72953.1 hypothetical protein THAOC_05462 [Thalassiosira oceanica]
MEKTTTVLLLKTIANHAAWSSLHVAARYLQVHAEPRHFDGMVVVSSTKGFAAIFRFSIGAVSSFWTDSKRAGFERLASVDGEPSSIEDTVQVGHPTTRGRRRLRFMPDAGHHRVAGQVHDQQSVSPAALADHLHLFHWRCAHCNVTICRSRQRNLAEDIRHGQSHRMLAAVAVGTLLGFRANTDETKRGNTHKQRDSSNEQYLELCFPARLHIGLQPVVWGAFKYLIVRPKTLLAWCTISIGVYSFASVSQIKLVRSLGPGFYSWLEYAGISIMIVSVSVYLVRSQRWMEQREQNELQNEDGLSIDGDERTNAQC